MCIHTELKSIPLVKTMKRVASCQYSSWLRAIIYLDQWVLIYQQENKNCIPEDPEIMYKLSSKNRSPQCMNADTRLEKRYRIPNIMLEILEEKIQVNGRQLLDSQGNCLDYREWICSLRDKEVSNATVAASLYCLPLFLRTRTIFNTWQLLNKFLL